ncbi:hypothetical protein PanWU01x14_368730, partial [Parasponia andersonii]
MDTIEDTLQKILSGLSQVIGAVSGTQSSWVLLYAIGGERSRFWFWFWFWLKRARQGWLFVLASTALQNSSMRRCGHYLLADLFDLLACFILMVLWALCTSVAM